MDINYFFYNNYENKILSFNLEVCDTLIGRYTSIPRIKWEIHTYPDNPMILFYHSK